MCDSPASHPDTSPSSLLTRLTRSMRLLLHICRGLLTAALVLPRASPQKRDAIIRQWSRQLLDIFNLRLTTHGHIPDANTTGIMFVANHVSWIDIHAINSVRAVRFVAMAEIRQWPVFGWLAAQANTLFTDRAKRHDAGRMVSITANSLRAGDCLCYFPEGTTTDGTMLKPFKSSLMQAAVNANARLCPIAIRYPDSNGGINTELSYANRNLLQSLGKVLAQSAPVVELFFGEAIGAANQNRRDISNSAKVFISQSLRLDG